MAIRVMFSSMLFEPFARAQVQNRGGKKHNGCDSKDGVVHEEKDRVCVLRKCSEGNKEVVRSEGRSNEVMR